MKKILNNKFISLVLITIIYLVIFTISYIVVDKLKMNSINNLLINLLIASIIMTIIFYLLSFVFKSVNNYKIYSYMFILFSTIIYLKEADSLNIQSYIAIVLVAIVIILNIIEFILKFKSITIDTKMNESLKYNNPKRWFLINLGFYHLLPMLSSYFCFIVFSYYLELSTVKVFNLSTMIAFMLLLFGIILKILTILPSDEDKCRKSKLYKNARHPDLFSEVIIYLALFLMMLSLDDGKFLLLISPLSLFLYYAYIIVPIREKYYQLIDKDYLEYKNNTNLFIPFKKKINKKP